MLEKIADNAVKIWHALPGAWRETARDSAILARRPATEALNELLGQLQVMSPTLFAERIGVILRDEMSDLRQLPRQQYADLSEELITSICDTLAHIRVFWKDSPIYVAGLREVWVSSDPPLELVEGEACTLPLLRYQLRVKTLENLVFFLREHGHADCLVQTLKEQDLWDDRIKIVIRDQIEHHPTALYRTKHGWRGVRGAYSPSYRITGSCAFRLNSRLPPDWMSYMSLGETDSAVQRLKNLLRLSKL